MRKMKRLLAVMMAVMLVTASLHVSVFAAQAGGEEKVQEILQETGQGAAEESAEDAQFAEEADAEVTAAEGDEGLSTAEEAAEAEEEDEDLSTAEEAAEAEEEDLSAAEEAAEAEEEDEDLSSAEEAVETEEEDEDLSTAEEAAEAEEEDLSAAEEAAEAEEEDEDEESSAAEESAEEAADEAEEDAQDSSEEDSQGLIEDMEDLSEEAQEPAGNQEEDPQNGETAETIKEDPAQGGEPVAGDGTGAAGSDEPPLLEEDGAQETLSEEAVDAGGAAIAVEQHSQEEIRSFIRNHPAPQLDNTYAVTPSATAPYVAGELSDETKEYAFNALNQMRYIAGLPADVTEKAEYTEKAQAASLTNAAIGKLTHTPSQPADMDDDLYQLGYEGAQHSNIAWGSTNVPHSGAQSIVHSILLWMSDSDSSNIDRVGHRRWIINPDMKYAGFGETDGYSAVYAHDDSRGSTSYYGVAWPAQNMPVEYFNDEDAWSVSFGMDLTASNISVTLRRTDDGHEWTFQSGGSDGNFYVENNYYGQKGCVIFRPNDISYDAGDSFEVSISGVGSSPVTYTVDFFSICGGDHDYESGGSVEPTCTEQGESWQICSKCGDVKYSYMPANGHNYQAGETQDGLITMTCEDCGDVQTGSIPSSFTSFWKVGDPIGSYSYNVPSSLEVGSTLNYWINNIGYTAESDVHFDDFVVETDRSEDCEIIRSSGTEGSIVFHQAGTYMLIIYAKYNPSVSWRRTITVAKPLESATLEALSQPPYRYGSGVSLMVTTEGGKGTLKYTIILIKEDGTEQVLASDQTNPRGTFMPRSASTCRLRAEVKDTGDGNRVVASNVLELEILPGLVRVQGGKTVTAAGPLTYGQPLSELAVNNASFIASAGGASLEGTFAFEEPDLVLPAGRHRVGWTFTPDDSNYETLSNSLQVTVNKAVPVITENPSAAAVVYHPAGKLVHVALTGGEVSVPGSWEWADKETALQVPGGTYACTFVPEDGGNYESVEAEAAVTVIKAVPSVKSLTPSAITYGETLADSQLTGAAQYSSEDDTAVSGSFRWADDTVRPAVSDSGNTYYQVIFTPEDASNYEEVTTELQLTVEKAQHPEEMPPGTISVPFSTEKISNQILTDRNIVNWSFAEEELDKDLVAGESGTFALVYTGDDAGNYVTESAQIAVTRSSCEHNGDTYILNAKEATCTEEGSTGDVHCALCDEILESSTVIPAKGHIWDEGVITLEPTLEAEGIRKYTCTVCGAEKTGSIAKLIDIGNAQIENFKEEIVYSRTAVTQSPSILLDGVTLTAGTDYAVSYTNNINVGTAHMIITGKGLYGGSLDELFTISPASITDATVEGVVDKTYTGQAQTQSLTVTVGTATLEADTDYTLSYEDNINTGTAKVIITGKGNYTGSVSRTFTISSASINDMTVTGVVDKTYTGKEQTQTPTVKVGSVTIEPGTDYTLAYQNNINAGTATVTITGRGIYTGSVSRTFTIYPASIASAAVTGIVTKTYTGKAQTQALTVKVGTATLVKGTDYTLAYKNNINAGTATVTITGKGNYTGSVSRTFKISPASIKKIKVTGIKAKVWNGKAQKQTPVVKLGSKTLKSGTDYTLAYSNNKNVGKATVTIKGKGNYTGAVKKTFLINPKATTVSKVTAGTKQFTAVWKKQASQTTGYQLQYSTNKAFKSGNKTVKITSNSTVKRKVTGLKAKKTYYVRIRTYRTVKGKTYYSTWSTAKSVKTR